MKLLNYGLKKITTKKILEILNISRSSLFRMKNVIKN